MDPLCDCRPPKKDAVYNECTFAPLKLNLILILTLTLILIVTLRTLLTTLILLTLPNPTI